MRSKRPSGSEPSVKAGRCAQLEHCVRAYRAYLLNRGNAAGYVRNCEAAVAHLSMWMKQANKAFADLGGGLVAEFLERHLPRCRCTTAARHLGSVRAALGHLLVVLRARGAIAPAAVDTTPVAEELRRYDRYMDAGAWLGVEHPRQRAAHRARVVELALRRRAVAVRPSRTRAPLLRSAGRALRSRTSAPARSVVSALRGYFRWRATLGDEVHALIGALSYPANWQQASLPKTLKPEEVEQLVGSLGQIRSIPASRRRHGALCTRSRSAQRRDRPPEPGRYRLGSRHDHAAPHQEPARRRLALAGRPPARPSLPTCVHERPKTRTGWCSRRHIAPREQSIGAHLVRKTIRQAYARAGLPYTRSHLLRHTMASRLLDSGCSLKEVADVLRHRSLNTTLVYAKLDSRRLDRGGAALARDRGRQRTREPGMTIGLSALVERYLHERRRLGFQLTHLRLCVAQLRRACPA